MTIYTAAEQNAIDCFTDKLLKGGVTPQTFISVINDISDKHHVPASAIWDECAFIANDNYHQH